MGVFVIFGRLFVEIPCELRLGHLQYATIVVLVSLGNCFCIVRSLSDKREEPQMKRRVKLLVRRDDSMGKVVNESDGNEYGHFCSRAYKL